VLADDSGLEVRALDGRPGIATAYYGGPGLTWHERRLWVLTELAATGSTDRSARFVCYLHFIAADGREQRAQGFVEGTIAEEERGEQGFSFDPIFFYPPLGKTFAEIDADAKNHVSHRTRALAELHL
jgi:XTP/dITP diphosphohydrolase